MIVKKIFLVMLALVTASSIVATFRSQTINGSTGLITTPTARVGWENSDLGFDAGTHLISGGDSSITPKGTVSLKKRFELGGTFDSQSGTNENDFLMHGKLKFYPWNGGGNSALAVGGNVQLLNPGYDGGQFYLVSTFGGQFFGMWAETTLLLGKSFGRRVNRGDIDFSMGFELDLLPKYFKGYIHWLNDFANYSYSLDARGATSDRGIYNTGFRVDILKAKRGMSLRLDVLLLDAMDGSRSFATGLSFGMAL